VVKVRVGYTGGKSLTPTYHNMEKHSESLKIWFDPKKTTFEAILDVFFDIHDATDLCSTQYRSAIFYQNKDQEEIAKKVMARQPVKVVTALEAAKHWTDAEEYHQAYLAKHGY